LRTLASIQGNIDPRADDTSVENETEIAIKLIAQMATLTGAIARIRKGEKPIDPDPSLSHAANLLYMMTGKKPDAVLERSMDISLILHADHGMNASTFTTMVVNSSLSDMYGSVVAGIASLKGPLHGGANERVLYDLEEIGSVDNVEAWFAKAQQTKRKVMGFGHRVYKAYDPRARIFGPMADGLVDRDPAVRRLYDIAVKLDGLVCSQLGEKKIFPNVDFYSGLIYRAMAIETAMFTPIFAVSRISGWTARAIEYLQDNRIFRPRAIYVGPISMPYVPMDKR
jgi:citrate synthase